MSNSNDQLLTEITEPGDLNELETVRHSTAHIMAHAISRIWKDAKFGIGPTVEDGFYYDVDLPVKLTTEDLPKIEKEMKRIEEELIAQGKLPHVTWEKVVEHIDHAVKLVGADHVGLGSDFDGANMPEGLEDASKLPKITEALMRKGYSDSDIKKILGENTFRVMEAAEKVSAEMKAQNL